MIGSFDESRPEFKGFNTFYNSEIAPYLQLRETERKAAVAHGKKMGSLATAIGLGIAVFAFTREGSWPVLAVISVIAVVVGVIIANSIANKIKGEIKTFLLENVSSFLGLKFVEKGFDPPDLYVWTENKLLPRYDRADFEDQLSGVSHGANFQVCEAHMEKESRDKDGDTKWVTVFRGILIDVDFHQEFLGRTIVVRDAGMFNSKKKNDMKRVGLADPAFEKIFEAYGTDQVEARYLLTPDFMQRLVDLENSVSGKKIRFGFLHGKLHVAIEISNQFEINSMMHTLLDTSRTDKILDEIGAIFDVIDGAIKPLENRY